MKETRWYVESWSVTDGLAFASERTDDGTVANVVFLAPPYWSPVAVANVATAWAAQRASFQHGFFDAEGENEIAFGSLAEIREVLRRAYLASGYGTFPSGEGGEDGEVAPLPGGDGGEGGRGFNQVVERLSDVVDADSRRALADSLQTFYRREVASSDMPSTLVQYISSQTEQAARRAEMGGKAERHFFAALLHASVYVFGDYVYETPHYPWRWWTKHRMNPSSILTMIFQMPIRRHNGRVETLGDHLALASSSREYLRSIRRPADLLPLFLGALFISAANDDLPWYGRAIRRDVVDDACRWLAANVPGIIANDHPASAPLEQFVTKMRDEGPAAVRPHEHLSAAVAT